MLNFDFDQHKLKSLKLDIQMQIYVENVPSYKARESVERAWQWCERLIVKVVVTKTASDCVWTPIVKTIAFISCDSFPTR